MHHWCHPSSPSEGRELAYLALFSPSLLAYALTVLRSGYHVRAILEKIKRLRVTNVITPPEVHATRGLLRVRVPSLNTP